MEKSKELLAEQGDVRKEHPTIEDYKRLEHYFMTTLQQNQISNWIYEISRRTIVLHSHTFYEFYKTENGEIPNIPESQIEEGVCHPDDVEILRRLYRRLDQGERHVEESLRFLDKRLKEYRWKKCIYTVVEDVDGKSHYAIGSAIDITEQLKEKRKYEAAVEYRKRTQVENLLLSGHCSVSEDIIIEMTDRTGTDLLQRFGNRRSQFFAGLEAMILDEKQRQEFHSLFTNESVEHNFELGIYKAELTCEVNLGLEQNRRIWAAVHMDAARVPETNNIEGFLTVIDVTDVHVQERILHSVVEHDYDYIMMVDIADSTYTLFSADTDKSMTEIPKTGDYEEEIRHYAETHVVPEDRQVVTDGLSIPFLQEQLAKNDEYIAIARLPYEDGTIHHKQVRVTYLDEEHTKLLITRVDVTDIIVEEQRKRSELEKALAIAEQATRAKTDFLSRMSHDIRTPMNMIIGMSALARDEIHDPAAIEAYLHKIDTAGKFLLGLVNDCLDLERIESNKMVLKVERYSYSDFLNGMRAMFLPLCAAKDIRFEIVKSSVAPDILVDRVRFEQIFFNLLSNSVKYTPEGGTILFRMRCSIGGDQLLHGEFEVRDNGIGMSKEFQARMFEPFEQESSAVVPQLQGSGLGLSIVKNIVDMMGGTIRIKSKVGAGTSTVVRLALPIADAVEAATETEQMSVSTEILADKRILMLEDHPLNAEIASKLLQKQGIRVTCAANGKEGLDIFATSDLFYYDAILMDIRMPVMDGYEATRAIRALNRMDAQSLPIIAMTANAYEEDVQKCLAAGMNAHLAKPIEPKLLYQMLAEQLSK